MLATIKRAWAEACCTILHSKHRKRIVGWSNRLYNGHKAPFYYCHKCRRHRLPM